MIGLASNRSQVRIPLKAISDSGGKAITIPEANRSGVGEATLALRCWPQHSVTRSAGRAPHRDSSDHVKCSAVRSEHASEKDRYAQH